MRLPREDVIILRDALQQAVDTSTELSQHPIVGDQPRVFGREWILRLRQMLTEFVSKYRQPRQQTPDETNPQPPAALTVEQQAAQERDNLDILLGLINREVLGHEVLE